MVSTRSGRTYGEGLPGSWAHIPGRRNYSGAIRTIGGVASAIGAAVVNGLQRRISNRVAGNTDTTSRTAVNYADPAKVTYRRGKRRYKGRKARRIAKYRKRFYKRVMKIAHSQSKYIMIRQQYMNIASVAKLQGQGLFAVGGIANDGDATKLDVTQTAGNVADYQDDDVYQVCKALAPSGLGSTDADRKLTRFYMKRCIYDYTFVGSNANNLAEVDIYEMICIRDLPKGTYTNLQDWYTHFINSDNPQANTVQRNIPNDSNSGVNYPANSTAYSGATVGSVPFDSPTVMRHFKVYKSTKHLIGAAAPFTYRMSTGNRLMNGELASDYMALKGYTKLLLCIVEGMYTATNTQAAVTLYTHVTKHLSFEPVTYRGDTRGAVVYGN